MQPISRNRLPASLLAVFSLLLAWTGIAAQKAVVNAILFYSPTCPHCHIVIEEVLPPLIDQYGDQLNILAINVMHEDGQALYQAMYQSYGLTEDRLGVPALVLGDRVMVGSGEIPAQLPGLIESGLSRGGVPYPPIPGLAALLEEQGLVQPQELSMLEKFQQDLLGNSLSVLVLLLMLATLLVLVVRLVRQEPGEVAQADADRWLFPLLAVAGFIVAGYLSYVEITRTEAVCGPVGDCNAVQSSPYARLFGVLPVGLLGLAGYGLILAAWLAARFGGEAIKRQASILLLGLLVAGLLFTIYLTFLEPFVIGATCAWCLSSALIMTVLFWLSMNDGLNALHELRQIRE